MTELDWGREYLAAKGAVLWRVPLDGTPPVELETPGNRKPRSMFIPTETGSLSRSAIPDQKSFRFSTVYEFPPALMPTSRLRRTTRSRKRAFDSDGSCSSISASQRDNTMSCATCHDPQRAFTDSRDRWVRYRRPHQPAPGSAGDRTARPSFGMDVSPGSKRNKSSCRSRIPRGWDLDIHEAATRVSRDTASLQRALASYVRTIFSGASPYDLYVQGKRDAFSF